MDSFHRSYWFGKGYENLEGELKETLYLPGMSTSIVGRMTDALYNEDPDAEEVLGHLSVYPTEKKRTGSSLELVADR